MWTLGLFFPWKLGPELCHISECLFFFTEHVVCIYGSFTAYGFGVNVFRWLIVLSIYSSGHTSSEKWDSGCTLRREKFGEGLVLLQIPAVWCIFACNTDFSQLSWLGTSATENVTSLCLILILGDQFDDIRTGLVIKSGMKNWHFNTLTGMEFTFPAT